MTASGRACLFVTAASMEMTWLSGIAIFLIYLFGAPPGILIVLPVAFCCSALLEWLIAGKGFRVISIITIKAIFLFLLLGLALYLSAGRSELIISVSSLETLIGGPRDMGEGILWGTAIIVTLLGWAGGMFSARHALDYYRISARFDLGIVIFILLFGGMGLVDLPAWVFIMLVISFFIFSLPSIALSRFRLAGERGTLLKQRREGSAVLLFTAAILLAGSGFFLLSYPFLTLAAQSGYGFIQVAGKQFVGFLGRIILFLHEFGSRLRRRTPAVSESGGEVESFGQHLQFNEAPNLFEQILFWAVVVILLLLLFFIIGWLFWHLFRWLFSGSSKAKNNKSTGLQISLLTILQSVVHYFRLMLTKIMRWLLHPVRSAKEKPATFYFRHMLNWGRRSGLPRVDTETASEYGFALKEYFPEICAEINLIVNSFNNEAYGGRSPDSARLKQLTAAWRRLCSPRRWVARLHSRIINGGRRRGL
jgi:hypothetical protein